jgi:hypothetical protein
MLQIAEGGRKAQLTREKVFINTGHLGARSGAAFRCQALEKVLKPTLDGGAADPFSLAHAAAVDPIPVLEKHAFPEGFSGSFAGQDTGKTLPETPSTAPAKPLVRFQCEHAMTRAPTFVPQSASPPALVAQAYPTAFRAGYRPAIARRYPNFPHLFFNACNLVSRQAHDRFISDQNISPQECLISLRGCLPPSMS